MASWTLRADRRRADFPQIVAYLRDLEAVVQDLSIDLLPEEVQEGAPDGGAFRDFVDLAHLHHPHTEALELVGEDLLAEFGWLIDFQR